LIFAADCNANVKNLQDYYTPVHNWFWKRKASKKSVRYFLVSKH